MLDTSLAFIPVCFAVKYEAAYERLLYIMGESLITMHLICIVLHCFIFKFLHIPRTTQINDK